MTKEEAVSKLHDLGYMFGFVPASGKYDATFTFTKEYPEYKSIRTVRIYKRGCKWVIQNEEANIEGLGYGYSATTMEKEDLVLFAKFVEGLK